MKRITIRDVAREANVSVTLVSFVMNAKRDKDGNLDCPVNPETAKRVLEVAQRLGYQRNFAAASRRSGRSNTIAVIPNDISNKFLQQATKVTIFKHLGGIRFYILHILIKKTLRILLPKGLIQYSNQITLETVRVSAPTCSISGSAALMDRSHSSFPPFYKAFQLF